jgi:hypothetical protein
LREFGILIDSVCHGHARIQQMIVKGNDENDVLTMPLDLTGCIVHFRHQLLTTEEVTSFKQYSMTQGDAPWNLS